jgi:hypothetical protein
MSGVLHGIGKVFKAVVIKPLKFTNRITHEVGHYIERRPILMYAIIAAACFFTAGAALGWFSGAGAATATGTAVTGDAVAGFSGQAALTGAVASGVPATAAISTGTLVGTGGLDVATLGGMTVTAAAAAPVVAGGITAADLASVGVASAAVASQGYLASQANANMASQSQPTNTASTPPTNTASTPPGGNTPAPDTAGPPGPSFLDRVGTGVRHFFSGTPAGANTAGGAGGAGGSGAAAGGLSSTTKLMLLQGGLQVASQMLNKPVPQMSYAGVNARGNGPGLNIHTINGGFGLAVGGNPEAAPTGVPANLRPGGLAPNSGAALSNAAITSGNSTSTAGNLGQTVANSAGIGGLVPQGAVNYMGGNS